MHSYSIHHKVNSTVIDVFFHKYTQFTAVKKSLLTGIYNKIYQPFSIMCKVALTILLYTIFTYIIIKWQISKNQRISSYYVFRGRSAHTDSGSMHFHLILCSLNSNMFVPFAVTSRSICNTITVAHIQYDTLYTRHLC